MRSDQQKEDVARTKGAVWYRLHSQREDLCEELVRNSQETNRESFADTPSAEGVTLSPVLDEQLQSRLNLIDSALDRLMPGLAASSVPTDSL